MCAMPGPGWKAGELDINTANDRRARGPLCWARSPAQGLS